MPSNLSVLKGLADKTRLQIIDILIKNDLCVGRLAEEVGISEPAVSQHLKILREAGLVRGEKRGYHTHYLVNKEAIHHIADELEKMTEDGN